MIYDVGYNEVMEDYLYDIQIRGLTNAATVEDFVKEECEPFSFNLSLGSGWGRLMDIANSKDMKAYLCYQGPNGYYLRNSGFGTIRYINPTNPYASSEFEVTGEYADLAASGDSDFSDLLYKLGNCALDNEMLDPFCDGVDLAVFARADR